MKYLIYLLCGFVLFSSANAENSTRLNGYTIHHNALTTDILTPAVASQYTIQRSKGRALVNISVIKDSQKGQGSPVSAKVKLFASNLLGQKREFPTREVREGQAIYYLADFPVGHRERLVFEIEARPEGLAFPLRAKFQQEFFTD